MGDPKRIFLPVSSGNRLTISDSKPLLWLAVPHRIPDWRGLQSKGPV